MYVFFLDVDYQHRTAFGFLQMAQCYAIGQWMEQFGAHSHDYGFDKR